MVKISAFGDSFTRVSSQLIDKLKWFTKLDNIKIGAAEGLDEQYFISLRDGNGDLLRRLIVNYNVLITESGMGMGTHTLYHATMEVNVPKKLIKIDKVS